MKRKTKQARPKEAQQQLRVVALRNRRMANCKLQTASRAKSRKQSNLLIYFLFYFDYAAAAAATETTTEAVTAVASEPRIELSVQQYTERNNVN